MRAVMCHALGPPEQLVIEERPDPEPGPGQVRIRVEAAGVNFADALVVQGGYQVKPPLPFTPGMELAGVVDRVGDGVGSVAAGDRVMAMGLGAFTDTAVVPARARPARSISVAWSRWSAATARTSAASTAPPERDS